MPSRPKKTDRVKFVKDERLQDMADRACQEVEMANGCLIMVKEALEGLGVDMSACPPMMYPEAIRKAVADTKARQAVISKAEGEVACQKVAGDKAVAEFRARLASAFRDCAPRGQSWCKCHNEAAMFVERFGLPTVTVSGVTYTT